MSWFLNKLIQVITACYSINLRAFKGSDISFAPVVTHLARSIPGIFAECSLNVAMFWASREHLSNIFKENIFSQIHDGKVVFVLKMYDLKKANVDLLANSSNVKAIFPDYSKNIPRNYVSKIFQGYPCKVVKMFSWSQKVQKIVL